MGWEWPGLSWVARVEQLWWRWRKQSSRAVVVVVLLDIHFFVFQWRGGKELPYLYEREGKAFRLRPDAVHTQLAYHLPLPISRGQGTAGGTARTATRRKQLSIHHHQYLQYLEYLQYLQYHHMVCVCWVAGELNCRAQCAMLCCACFFACLLFVHSSPAVYSVLITKLSPQSSSS